MLRVLIGLLLVANALVWVWSSNGLARWGLAARPATPVASVPEMPIDAERILPNDGQGIPPSPVISSSEQALQPTSANADWACWRLGPFAPSEQLYLQSLMPLNNDQVVWDVKEMNLPERWAVATPKSSGADLARWVEQAKVQNIDHRTSDADTLRGRLILATFVNRELANTAAERLREKGWDDLAVVRERPPINALSLEVRSASESTLTQIKARIAPVPTLAGQALQVSSCPSTLRLNASAPVESTVPQASSSGAPPAANEPARATPIKP